MDDIVGDEGLVDVAIVGGGAAGLSAALTLSRARRSVVVIDAGEPRNAPAAHTHGYLTRDGISPSEFLRIGRDEVRGYGGLIVDGRAINATKADDATFSVNVEGGQVVRSRRLLVATSLADELPAIVGLAERWGRDAVHCPYCHGWELRDQRLGVISSGPMGVHQASLFRQWSSTVTLFQHTGPIPTEVERNQLASRSVSIVEGIVAEVVVVDDRITGLRLTTGELIAIDAVVVGPRMVARADVLASLGIKPVEHMMCIGTSIEANEFGATSVAGVFVAGNLADLRGALSQATSSGSWVAAAINADLIAEDTARAVAVAAAATPVAPVLDRAFWEKRYESAPQIWSGNPNPQLISDVAALKSGRALDVGAGEGADAIWLAERGWQVTAADISSVALERGSKQALERGTDVAERITWTQADFNEWTPAVHAFDLVSAQFMHLPSVKRIPLYQRCIDAVAPGGTLLIVGHHISDLDTDIGRWRMPDWFFTAEDIAAMLGDSWSILACDKRPRTATNASGASITIHDAVLTARRNG